MKKTPSLKELDEADAGDTLGRWHPERTDVTLKYAWNWFAYHASQRLQAFNFFLLILAALATGYLTALDKDYGVLQIAIGVAGILISFAFLALDFRNEQLVTDGRHALRQLERALGTEIHRSDYDRVIARPLSELLFGVGWPISIARWPVSIRHSDWLRRIERFALILFVIATIVGVAHVWIDYWPPVADYLRAHLPAKS
jgi:hypothetical protein